MEEWVGLKWHRWATRHAERTNEAAQALLEPAPLGLLLRAAGGGTRRIAEALPVPVGSDTPRNWWQRIAGTGLRECLPQLDAEVLALPPRLALHGEPQLNAQLYRWWALLAAHHGPERGFCRANRAATERLLTAFPALQGRWQRLLAAELARRGAVQSEHEALLRRWLALDQPAPDAEPDLARLAPLWCWLLPVQGEGGVNGEAEPGAGSEASNTPGQSIAGRRRVHKPVVSLVASRHPLLLAAKTEWLKTFADPLPLDRAHDDQPEPQDAQAAADTLDALTLQRMGSGSRIRFDLDLPAAEHDDLRLGEPDALPEWDPRGACLQPLRVSVQRYAAREPGSWTPDASLRVLATQLRRRMAVQQAAPRWQRAQPSGELLDLDALVRERALPQAGTGLLWMQPRRRQRELATLLMADLSMSTDAHVSSEQRVIDVIRDSLYVFGEALAGSGDALALFGFSSVRRHLRLHEIKGFDTPWGPRTLQALGGLRPGYYTRMGAALRAATRELVARPERQRLLLLLTDGKPHDLDGYDGRLGLEDTREALREARAAGLTPFALSIDSEPPTVLAPLFGTRGHAWVRRCSELPRKLLALHASLVR
ncbi:nitric oxide reductase activation protein NorD [Inhella sp.]|uniref:nitric oxide reductase activation protein NorD n=1 Tax=Inhella sp. TaxID=1921806 RepID=UPI0035AEA860